MVVSNKHPIFAHRNQVTKEIIMNDIESTKGEIVMYQPDETIRLEVRVENETVWLTQQQMADLFNATKQNVSLHINNIYDEGELERGATVKDYLTVRKEGKRTVRRHVNLYNLDVIIRQLYQRRYPDHVEQSQHQSLCHHLHSPALPTAAARRAASQPAVLTY